jgi:hypothetical protein
MIPWIGRGFCIDIVCPLSRAGRWLDSWLEKACDYTAVEGYVLRRLGWSKKRCGFHLHD